MANPPPGLDDAAMAPLQNAAFASSLDDVRARAFSERSSSDGFLRRQRRRRQDGRLVHYRRLAGAQGHKTLLLTTDPAAHLGDVLDTPVGDEVTAVSGQPNLWAVNIDPKAAAETYKTRILDDARQRGRPESAIKVMEEELNSPCTEEMAAFDKFIEYASQDEWDSVVFDTAPTGHTLRLLELPVDWSKQIDVKVFASVDGTAADDVAKERFGKVIEMMSDPEQSTFAFVMYPESTPILEAWRAAQELGTVGVHPGLVVANMVIPPEQTTTPFVQSRRIMQEKYLGEIGERFGVPLVQIPLLPREVKGLGCWLNWVNKSMARR
jgi:arsenite/tail-anchored protein-transporting ATPase